MRYVLVLAFLSLNAVNGNATVKGCPTGQAIRGVDFIARTLVCVPIVDPAALSAETAARQAADAFLQSGIDNEAQARQTADQQLTTRIDNLQAGTSSRPKIWSGSCASTASATNSFIRYCASIVHFNTAGSELSVDPNGEATVLTSGYYRVAFIALGNGCGAQAAVVRRNGDTSIVAQHALPGGPGDVQLDVTLRLLETDKITVEVFQAPGCANQAYLGGPTLGRLEFHFLGPL